MSKEKDTAKIINVKWINDPNQTNYEGQKWLSWFNADAQNVQSCIAQIFRGYHEPTGESFKALLKAGLDTLNEITIDLQQLTDALNAYNNQNEVK